MVSLQYCMQDMHSRQWSPAVLPHANCMTLSGGNSTVGTLPEEDGRGQQNIAELNCATEVSASVQTTTAADCETDTLLSSNELQQASSRHETTTGNLTAAKSNLGSVRVPASAMLYCSMAASTLNPMAGSTRLEGIAPFGTMPAQPSSPEHDSVESESESEADLCQQMQPSTRQEQLIASCSAAGKSYAGVPDHAELHAAPFAAVLESSSSSSSPFAPSSMVADSMSTPKAGISERSGPAVHDALPQLPESRHSKGLQQLWNSVAHTPLPVPSPCSMAVDHSKLDRLQCKEQGHQHVLVPEMTAPAEGTSQSSIVSTMSGSAASELIERATAHLARSKSPMEGDKSSHRSVPAAVVYMGLIKQ